MYVVNDESPLFANTVFCVHWTHLPVFDALAASQVAAELR